jgi:DNA replication protein DnaC
METVNKEAIRRLDAQIEAQREREQVQIAESIQANTSRIIHVKTLVAIDKQPYTCPDCGETQEYEQTEIFRGMSMLRREPCACEREADAKAESDAKALQAEEAERRLRSRIAHLRETSGLVGKLSRMRLEDMDRQTPIKPAIEWAEGYLAGWPQTRGVLIGGPFGCGKTHVVAAVGNELIERDVRVSFEVGFDLLERIRRSYDVPDPDGPDVCEHLSNVPLLIYDDLGNERIAAGDRGDWAREKILRIFYWRDVRELPTLITSNYTVKELGVKIGFATVSRILGCVAKPIVIPQSAGDYRLRK